MIFNFAIECSTRNAKEYPYELRFGFPYEKNLRFLSTSFMLKTEEKTIIAIYVRVSTHKKQQIENHLHELREYYKRMHYEIFQKYIDNEDRAKSRRERKGFAQMLQDAYQHYNRKMILRNRLARNALMGDFMVFC